MKISLAEHTRFRLLMGSTPWLIDGCRYFFRLFSLLSESLIVSPFSFARGPNARAREFKERSPFAVEDQRLRPTGVPFGGFRHFSGKINGRMFDCWRDLRRDATGINTRSRVVCVFIERDIGGWRPFVTAVREPRDFVSDGQGFMHGENNFSMI